MLACYRMFIVRMPSLPFSSSLLDDNVFGAAPPRRRHQRRARSSRRHHGRAAFEPHVHCCHPLRKLSSCRNLRGGSDEMFINTHRIPSAVCSLTFCCHLRRSQATYTLIAHHRNPLDRKFIERAVVFVISTLAIVPRYLPVVSYVRPIPTDDADYSDGHTLTYPKQGFKNQNGSKRSTQ